MANVSTGAVSTAIGPSNRQKLSMGKKKRSKLDFDFPIISRKKKRV
jgi:hypothetical protein